MILSHHVGCWELNPGPLEEQLVFLTTETSFQQVSKIYMGPDMVVQTFNPTTGEVDADGSL